MTTPPAQPDEHHPLDLCPQDQAALEALLDAGCDPGQVDQLHRPRAQRLAQVLGLLDGCEGHDDSLIGRTLQACTAHTSNHEHTRTGLTLDPRDDDALEALVSGGMDPGNVAGAMRPRARHQRQLLGLLELSGTQQHEITGARETLVASTLACVQHAIDTQQQRLVLDARPPARRWRGPDLAGIAAMLLVGTALIYPAVGYTRDRARQAACLSNLGSVASALGLYGSAHREQLPLASAAKPGTPWWNVGHPEQSNAANFFTLVRLNYAPIGATACAGNEHATSERPPEGAMDWSGFNQVSFSFQNLFAVKRATLNQPVAFAVVVDRSPVVTRARRGERVVFANENAFNHARRGQNLLLSDGTASWQISPVLPSGDNIWLPRAVEAILRQAQHGPRAGQAQPLQGVEQPDGPEDSFLCP